MTTQPAAVTAGVPEQRLNFTYDAQGRRVRKKVEEKIGGVWTLKNDVRFIYDGWNLMAEVEYHPTASDAPASGGSAGTRAYLRRTYVWGPDVSGTVDGAGGVGGLLMMTRHERGAKPAESYWANMDLNGNVIGLVSTAVPDRYAVYDYDGFGKCIRANEPEAGLNPVRFSSKYADAETGLSYYGYRYYSSENGRWISRDPIGEKGGFNLYILANNNAVSKIDILGMTDVAEVLNEYFKRRSVPDPGPKLWVMDESDSYTEVVRKWDVVKKKLMDVPKTLIVSPGGATHWKKNHSTESGWTPGGVGALTVPKAHPIQITSPAGTDPVTAGRYWAAWKATGSAPSAMNTAAIGSFTLYVSVDEVDERRCKAKLDIWMFNSMSKTSFTNFFAQFFPNSYQNTQYMWWHWKDEFSFAEVPAYTAGSGLGSGSGSGSGASSGTGGGW